MKSLNFKMSFLFFWQSYEYEIIWEVRVSNNDFYSSWHLSQLKDIFSFDNPDRQYVLNPALNLSLYFSSWNGSFKILILSSRYQNTNVNKLFHHEKTLWTNNSDEVDRSWKSDICLANKRLIDTKWPKRCRIVTIAIYFSGESHKKQLMFLRL